MTFILFENVLEAWALPDGRTHVFVLPFVYFINMKWCKSLELKTRMSYFSCDFVFNLIVFHVSPYKYLNKHSRKF